MTIQIPYRGPNRARATGARAVTLRLETYQKLRALREASGQTMSKIVALLVEQAEVETPLRTTVHVAPVDARRGGAECGAQQFKRGMVTGTCTKPERHPGRHRYTKEPA